MDDTLRALQRAALRGDEAARSRLGLELERLGPAAFPFRGIQQPPAPEVPGPDDPILSTQNAQKAGADFVWQVRSRRGAAQKRQTKRGGRRRQRSRVRQTLRAWSRDPRDYQE